MYLTLGEVQELLRIGSTGEGVRTLQQRLIEKGYKPGPVDGIFGAQTASALREFQRNAGLSVDGVVGLQTWAALQSLGPATVPAPPTPPPAMVAPVALPPATGAARRPASMMPMYLAAAVIGLVLIRRKQ